MSLLFLLDEAQVSAREYLRTVLLSKSQMSSEGQPSSGCRAIAIGWSGGVAVAAEATVPSEEEEGSSVPAAGADR